MKLPLFIILVAMLAYYGIIAWAAFDWNPVRWSAGMFLIFLFFELYFLSMTFVIIICYKEIKK
jgi:hypothetical protein